VASSSTRPCFAAEKSAPTLFSSMVVVLSVRKGEVMLLLFLLLLLLLRYLVI
jgi:hypothetical protein